MSKDRYKFIVQVILGNQKGQGVQAGCKNFWDTDTDAMSFEQYVDDNLFCLVTVWAVYVYWGVRNLERKQNWSCDFDDFMLCKAQIIQI